MATLKDVEKNRIIQAELSYGNKNLVFSRPKDVLLKKGTTVRVLASVGNLSSTKAMRFTYDSAIIKTERAGKVHIHLHRPIDERLKYEVEIPSISTQENVTNNDIISKRRAKNETIIVRKEKRR